MGMTMSEADQMIRVNVEWSIEGRSGTQTGKLYDLHEQEVMGVRVALRQRAKRGDTVSITLL